VKPRASGRRLSKVSQPLERDEERILQRILGFRSLTEDR
jgi:hypothetical protein